MRPTIVMILLLVAVITAPPTSWAQGDSPAAPPVAYRITAGNGTEVVFESRAPMEKFKGRTEQVTGWLEADLDDLSSPFRFEVKVDLASFDTGNSKRNQHMRENHLETDRFPTAVFTGGELAGDPPTEVPTGGAAALRLTGNLDLHGISREMTCDIEVERPDAQTLLVTARFEVLLPDHRIERPKFLFLKLAEDQKVTVRLVMKKGP